LAENASFDVLINENMSSRFCFRRRQEKREGQGSYTQSQDVIFQLLWGRHPWSDSHKIGMRVVRAATSDRGT